MKRRFIFYFAVLALSFLSLCFLACSKSDMTKDSYLRFTVEGQQYQVNDMVFMYASPGGNKYSFMLFQDLLKKKMPSASIHWNMELGGLEELKGAEIDLLKLDSEAKAKGFAPPSVSFQVEEKAEFFPDFYEGGQMSIRINRINEKYIEGSFSGTKFKFIALENKVLRPVDGVTGRFRAKIIHPKK